MGNEQYILNTVNKGLKMGMDSISTISEKVGDENFKDDLIYQYNQYNDILNKSFLFAYFFIFWKHYK